MDTLDLTHTGTFSERTTALFEAILGLKGHGELSTGIGQLPGKPGVWILVGFAKVATAYNTREVKGLIEIIAEACKDEEPYSQTTGEIFDQLLADLRLLYDEAKEIEARIVDEKLNLTRH